MKLTLKVNNDEVLLKNKEIEVVQESCKNYSIRISQQNRNNKAQNEINNQKRLKIEELKSSVFEKSKILRKSHAILNLNREKISRLGTEFTKSTRESNNLKSKISDFISK